MSGPERHVQIATKHGKLWTRAWGTDVPGLVVVYDTDNDRWTLTHKASGKSVLAVTSNMVALMQEAASKLQELDWTVDEEGITEQHKQAAGTAKAALLQSKITATEQQL